MTDGKRMRKEDLLPKDSKGNIVLDLEPAPTYRMDGIRKGVLFSTVRDEIRKNTDTKRHTAAVLIVRDGRFLVGDRSDGKGLCGPGGHAQWGETPAEAARREAKEEFGITPKNLRPLNSGKFGVNTAYFWTDEFSGEPKTDNEEMFRPRWLSAGELRRQKMHPHFEESVNLYLMKERG